MVSTRRAAVTRFTTLHRPAMSEPASGRLVQTMAAAPLFAEVGDRDLTVIEVDLHTGTQTTFTVKAAEHHPR